MVTYLLMNIYQPASRNTMHPSQWLIDIQYYYTQHKPIYYSVTLIGNPTWRLDEWVCLKTIHNMTSHHFPSCCSFWDVNTGYLNSDNLVTGMLRLDVVLVSWEHWIQIVRGQVKDLFFCVDVCAVSGVSWNLSSRKKQQMGSDLKQIKTQKKSLKSAICFNMLMYFQKWST